MGLEVVGVEEVGNDDNRLANAMLDDLDDRGYRFMLVETLSFDDVTDKALRRWAKRYKSTPVDGSRLNIEQIIITNY